MSQSQLSLLVVDDNEMNRDLLARQLEKDSYTVTRCEGGQQALDFLQVEQFDLILLDIMMPGMDGYQVLEKLKIDDKLKNIPVMMVTAVSEMENVVKCINLGANDYVTKPFDPAVLKTRIWRLLQKFNRTGNGNQNGGADYNGTAHILIVDDNEMNRDILRARVEQFKHSVEEADSAAAALAKLKEQTYDLVLLDIHMPEKNGFDTLRDIKSDPRTAELNVVMISADDDPATIEKCMKLGASDYVTKPYNSILLKTRLNSILSDNNQFTLDEKRKDFKTRFTAEIAARLKSGNIKLPIMPDVGFTIAQMALMDDVSINDITDVIKVDPTLTSRLITIANSSFYKGSRSISSLEDAVLRIGLKDTQNFVLTITNKEIFKTDNAALKKLAGRLWDHSIAVAACAKVIALDKRTGNAEQLYTMGLLHDIGKPILLQIISDLDRDGGGISESSVVELLDSFHPELGAFALKQWKFSQEFVNIAQKHHDESALEDSPDCKIVSLANKGVRLIGMSLKETSEEDFYADPQLADLDYDQASFETVLENTKQYVSQIKSQT